MGFTAHLTHSSVLGRHWLSMAFNIAFLQFLHWESQTISLIVEVTRTTIKDFLTMDSVLFGFFLAADKF